jgi:hypothetical protein
MLLTLSGWTNPRIAGACSVRKDTVRLWRCDFSRGGTDALKASVAPGPPSVKSEASLPNGQFHIWVRPVFPRRITIHGGFLQLDCPPSV